MQPTLDQLPAVAGPPDERRFWRKLTAVLTRIPFAEDLVAAFCCASDPATPGRVRGYLYGAIAYFLLPTDMLPDFIAVLGFSDDAVVIAAVLRLLGQHITPAHRAEARRLLARLQRV